MAAGYCCFAHRTTTTALYDSSAESQRGWSRDPSLITSLIYIKGK
jgi:hypothetical protein